MGGALNSPKRPFVAVLGGAKVSDKIGVINNLLEKADTIIIGGGMAYTFVKAMGHEIGSSCSKQTASTMQRKMIAKAQEKGVKFLLPVDTAIGNEFKADCEKKIVDINEMPEGWMGMDIGRRPSSCSLTQLRAQAPSYGTDLWAYLSLTHLPTAPRQWQRHLQTPTQSPSSAAATAQQQLRSSALQTR